MPPSSMTGFGRASLTRLGLTTIAEIRSTNNRFLKVSSKLPAFASDRAHEIETRIRAALTRGSVDVGLKIQRRKLAAQIQVDEEAALAYLSFARRLEKKGKGLGAATVTDLMTLPGVIGTGANEELKDEEWSVVLDCLEKALRNHVSVRKAEGRRLAAELRKRLQELKKLVARIKRQAPRALADHRTRLKERLDRTLAKMGSTISDADLLREVAIYCDRTDISEELERLASHCTQFSTVLGREGEVGRELDFVLQEMFREINTIGSKAGDAEISHRVVAVKVEIEKMREQVQNLE